MTVNHWIRVQLLIAVVLTSACSSWQQPPDDATPSSIELTANSEIKYWQLRGKIGLRNGNQAHSAYLNWTQCGDAYDIKITGPLGQGAAHLYGNSTKASLENSHQQLFHASTPEQLLQQQLGWSFPVSQLYYWLRGIPSPSDHYQAGDDQSDFSQNRFSQNQWQLNYPRFSTINGYQLPIKIIAQQPPLKVTLIIKQWQLDTCELEP